jgi:hypothetical protein
MERGRRIDERLSCSFEDGKMIGWVVKGLDGLKGGKI